jgi:predicted membrane metal-binding protein
MSAGKEVVFAVLIVMAPHLSQQLAAWMVFGLILAAIWFSDTITNMRNRIWWRITRQD